MNDVLGSAKSAKKPALDLTSRSFHAKKFLKEVVGGAPHIRFEDKIVDEIGKAVEETDEALKQLIRDNLEVFINSKDAMTAVYSRDQGLFTGEALNDISSAFKLALGSCSKLVKPTTDSFLSVRRSRKTQEILEKLFSMLSIPGVLYECCGVRVAHRKIQLDLWELNDLDAEDREEKKSLRNEVQEREVDVNDAASVHSSNSSDAGVDGSTNVRGALEEFVSQACNSAAGEYVVHSNQEIFYWYGTPLLRLKDASVQRRYVEKVSNYSGAMLNLRRAMLYIEENYNLEDGTLLAAGDVDVAASHEVFSNHHASVVNDGSEIDNAGRKRSSAVGQTSFTYQFAVSLLRAMLYLEDQLAEELRYANGMDVVLIEDTLSMMMEVAIASVKLYHFCFAMRNSMLGGCTDVLVGLREKVAEGTAAAAVAADACAPGEGRSQISFARAASHYSDSDTEHGETTSNVPSPSEGATDQGTENTKWETMHPAQHLINIVCDQNTSLTHGSAAALLSEATEWLHKLYSIPAMTEGQRQRSRGYGDATQDAVQGTNGKTPGRGVDSFFNNPSFCEGDPPAFRVGGAGADAQGVPNTALGAPLGEADWTRSSDAEAILRAFHTPEMKFETYTSFTFGDMCMDNILESSCEQMNLHSHAMLQQLGDCANSEGAIMAQAVSLNSFASRLCEVCVANVEQAIVSYWTGIATSLRAGIFDFHPDRSTPLYRMLQDAVVGGGGGRGWPTGASGRGTLPPLRYVPVLPESLRAEGGTGGGKGHAREASTGTLRGLSVRAVHHMLRAARETLGALFLSFVNRSVGTSFGGTMARYTLADLAAHAKDERVELHAAVLVEVILGQWERMMSAVDQSAWRIKLVIGGSYSANATHAEHQMNDVGELLEAIEKLRSDCFNCYLHGIGVLSKAYVSLLPMLSPSSINTASLEYRVRARLSRDFVSSFYPNKFLNILSVVMDRTISFIQRHIKVNDGAGLFSSKATGAETLQGGTEDGETDSHSEPQQRRRMLQQDHNCFPSGASGVASSRCEGANNGTGTTILASKSAQAVAEAHAKLVLSHIDAHEERVQALVANLLLSFVDMLHNRCRAISVDPHVELEGREGIIMECVADALCTAAAVSSTVLDHMLKPCLFSLMAQLHSASPSEVNPLIKQRENVFRQKYLSRVGEHCQLAVDAMLRMYIAIPQQHITHEVRLRGFMSPLFDWQRVSSQVGMAVRPYIAKCIVYVAKAHETLDCIHQPTLGAAVMQRLIAHLAMAFVTAVSADVNAFEISLECSPSFLDHATLLIEAEALTILELAHAMVRNVEGANTARGVVLPELQLARNCLQGLVRSLEELGVAARANELKTSSPPSLGPSPHGKEAAPLGEEERRVRRNGMVATAMAHLKYMVDAINSNLLETSALGGAPLQPVSNEATQSIADRLARRREGYEVSRIAEGKSTSRRASTSRKKNSRGGSRTTAPLPLKEESSTHNAPPLAQESDSDKIAAVELYQIAVEQSERKPDKMVSQNRRSTRVTVVQTEKTSPPPPPLMAELHSKDRIDGNNVNPEAIRTAPRRHERRAHNFKRSNVM